MEVEVRAGAIVAFAALPSHTGPKADGHLPRSPRLIGRASGRVSYGAVQTRCSNSRSSSVCAAAPTGAAR